MSSWKQSKPPYYSSYSILVLNLGLIKVKGRNGVHIQKQVHRTKTKSNNGGFAGIQLSLDPGDMPEQLFRPKFLTRTNLGGPGEVGPYFCNGGVLMFAWYYFKKFNDCRKSKTSSKELISRAFRIALACFNRS